MSTPTYLLDSSRVVSLGTASSGNRETGGLTAQIIGATWSGSAIPKARVPGAGIANGNLTPVRYVNVGTQQVFPANTPITADGIYAFLANGLEIALDYTHTSGSAKVSVLPGVGVPGWLVTAQPTDWSVTHTPAAATQATATKAAGAAGVQHICTSITATIATAGTAQAAAAILNLRDGATGAGTILWSQQVILPVNAVHKVEQAGLNIVGSAATAMTLEFSAAGVAGSFESVALTGRDIP